MRVARPNGGRPRPLPSNVRFIRSMPTANAEGDVGTGCKETRDSWPHSSRSNLATRPTSAFRHRHALAAPPSACPRRSTVGTPSRSTVGMPSPLHRRHALAHSAVGMPSPLHRRSPSTCPRHSPLVRPVVGSAIGILRRVRIRKGGTVLRRRPRRSDSSSKRPRDENAPRGGRPVSDGRS